MSANHTLSNVPASGATRRPPVSGRQIGGGWILWERHQERRGKRKRRKEKKNTPSYMTIKLGKRATGLPKTDRCGWIIWERHQGLKRNQGEGYLSHTIPKDKSNKK